MPDLRAQPPPCFVLGTAGPPLETKMVTYTYKGCMMEFIVEPTILAVEEYFSSFRHEPFLSKERKKSFHYVFIQFLCCLGKGSSHPDSGIQNGISQAKNKT